MQFPYGQTYFDINNLKGYADLNNFTQISLQ